MSKTDTQTIRGPFEVNSQPLPPDALDQAVGAGRMQFDKKFTGPLTATSTVSMQGIMNRELGSGAYVALERITGTLDGKKGSFALMHACSMDRGAQKQDITVVPGSGTDQLVGLTGHMTIEIQEDDAHFYTLSYSIN